MIQSFKHKGLKELFVAGKSKNFSPELAKKLLRRLDLLNRAKTALDMRIPGFDFHELKGNRAGTYAVDITGNYRLTFRFPDRNAVDVNFEDYH